MNLAPRLLPLAALLSAAACTTAATDTPPMSAPVPAPVPAPWSDDDIQSGKSCGADQRAGWIGKTATEEAIAMLRQWRGDSHVRVLGPNSAMTMDYRPDRLNVNVDAGNMITGFRCV